MVSLSNLPISGHDFYIDISTVSQSPPHPRAVKRLGFGPLSLRCRGWMTRHDTTGSGAQHQWSLRRMIGLREVASGDDLETWICFFDVGFSWWITIHPCYKIRKMILLDGGAHLRCLLMVWVGGLGIGWFGNWCLGFLGSPYERDSCIGTLESQITGPQTISRLRKSEPKKTTPKWWWKKVIFIPCCKIKKLVCGFNPFEKYSSKWE